MTISKDLFLAILSMDAYNRGYGAAIAESGESDPDGLGEIGQLGNAVLLTRAALGVSALEYQQWQNEGFYAVAYDVSGVSGFSADETVVSYRGTDEASELPLTDIPIIFGDYDEEQLSLAAAFYRSVEQNLPQGGTIAELTGHSLGGALAGFVGSLFGTSATIVDHIDFYSALENFLGAWEDVEPYIDEVSVEDALALYRLDNPSASSEDEALFEVRWTAVKAY